MLLVIFYQCILMKKNKFLNFLLIVILMIYVASYYVANSSYYEYKLQERTVLTNEKIKEFEEDVKNNENIDIKDYVVSEEVDYSNKISNLVYNFSDTANNVARKCIKAIFKKLSYLVED